MKSLLASIFGMNCPRCRRGKMFETGSFRFKKPFDMNERCASCGQNFTPEIGFYYGSMFVSYILTGWFCIFFMLGTHWWLGWSFDLAFIVMLFVVALLFVWFFRISRSIWIHLNVKNDPGALN